MFKKIEEFEKHLIENFNAQVSTLSEIEKYEHYSLVGDNEHDYSLLKKVYKIPYKEGVEENGYDVVFILLFSKQGGIYDSKTLGRPCEKLENIWLNIEWEK